MRKPLQETVVSDATPISQLAKIGQLDLLHHLFNQVLVPQEVYDELLSGSHPAVSAVQSAAWIKIQAVRNAEKVQSLYETTPLGLGECAALVLAEEVRGSRLLLDDLAARRVAEAGGQAVTGTVGALLLAKRRGLISSVKAMLDDLRTCRTYISDELYAKALTAAGE